MLAAPVASPTEALNGVRREELLIQPLFASELRRRQRVDQQTISHQGILKGHGGEACTQLSLTVRPAQAIAGEHPVDAVKLGRKSHEKAQSLTDGSYHVALA